MKKSEYKAAQNNKIEKGNKYGQNSPGAFGFCLRPAGSKFREMCSAITRKSTDYYRAAGRLSIKPMGIVANYFADKRRKV